ncbi:MAG TPA: prepilin-type N-terminal cleavage/methylation domain-containing protein [Rhizomicrobium sp.]|jgi:prepilin-type N-terminal cleavage/methylation domain-containing protein|nr:prepilin-type N-terminal cleavage/methylation domain-containing protein [Rhizomicrobium sp.]
MSEAGNSVPGFTLLETLVVVAIMALIGAIVAPNLASALDTLSLQQTARLLQADLRVLRGTALRTGRSVDLNASNGGREYDWIGGTRYLPPAVRMSMARPIVAYPDGSVQTTPITVSTAHRRFVLTVDPINGAVVVSSQ